MDVTLPDGTVVQNVPEGTTKSQLVAKLKAAGHDTSWAPDHVNSPNVAPENRADYQYDPTSGMSWADKFFAGAGKAAVDMGRGIRQLGAEAGQLVGLNTNADQYRQQQDEINQQDAPLMQTGAGIVGNIAGNIATTYAGGSLLRGAGALAGAGRVGQALTTAGNVIASPNTVRGAATAGAVMGGIQPVGTEDSRTLNTALGAGTGAASQAVGNVLGRIGSGSTKGLNPADARAVRTLEQNGVQLDAAQKTGSTMLQRVKAGLSDNPLTAGGQVEAADAQKAGFTRAVLAKINVNADAATPQVMGQARDDIGRMFDQALTGVSIKPSSGALNQMQVLAARSKRVLPGDTNQITRTVDDIVSHLSQNGGALDGAYYKTLRSDLSALTMQADVGPIARQLMNGLDNSFQQAAGPQNAALLQDARRLWRNMLVIEKAVPTDDSGMISAAKLANQFGTKANRNAGVYGKGDRSIVELAQLAKAGKRVIPEKLPNSGTAARVLMQGAAPAAIGAAYGYAKEGDLKGALMYGAGGMAAPLVAQQIINRPGAANYLANGLPQTGIAGGFRNMLIAAQQGGGPARLLPVAAVNALTK